MRGKNRNKKIIPNRRLKEVAAIMATSRKDKLPMDNWTVAKPAAASVLNGDQSNDRLTDIERKVGGLRESLGGVGTIVEEPGDLAGQMMGERIDQLENKVTELIAMLSITDKERNASVDKNQKATAKKRIKYVQLN